MKLKSETLKTLARYSWWVQNAKIKDSEFLRSIDRACVNLEQTESNKKGLEERAHRIFPNKQKAKNWKNVPISSQNKKQREYERQVRSLITEVLTANELKQQKFSDVKFIQESDKKTPDLRAKKGEKKFLIEVKQIRNPSAEDEALREIGFYTSNVNHNYRNAVKRKAYCFCCDALEKFTRYNQTCKSKILVIDYQPGIDTYLVPGPKPLSPKFWGNLEDVFEMEIWYRTYFKND